MCGKAVVIGTLDTKGPEFLFLKSCIAQNGVEALVVDVGVLGEPFFQADISREEVARAAGLELATLRDGGNRGEAVDAMARGAASIVRSLHESGALGGVISLGGTAGTTIGTHAMRALPVGVPKLQVSTVASGDTRPYVGAKDIAMMYSVVDIAGLNGISRAILSNAAGAIAGMIRRVPTPDAKEKPLIAATMFGVTTPCVSRARQYLEDLGYELLVFHATGSGGQSMEALIEGGYIQGVLDITTTEWADELVGGVFAAGPTRLEAAARAGVPQVVSVGALDMVNFGPMDTVPERFRNRRLYKHNASVTLMRTLPAENARLGEIIAEKLNMATGPAALYLPLRGVSMIDAPDQPFYWPEADAALFDSIRRGIDSNRIELHEMDCLINDDAFALAMAGHLHEMIVAQTAND